MTESAPQRPTWWSRTKAGTWRRWSHRRAAWERASGPPPPGADLADASEPVPLPPEPLEVRKRRHLVRVLLIAAAIMAGSMFLLWALAPVWDPFDVREEGTWKAYRDALPIISVIVLLVEAIAAMVGRVQRGEPIVPEDPPPPSPEELEAIQAERAGTGDFFRGLARMLAVGCAILAVATGLIGFSCAGQEPSEILGTDPAGAARSSFLMAGGFAVAAILLWWAGRDR